MADVTMPQLGETVTEGTITKWFKQVGDQVQEDEVLFEVSTDKVDSEVPSPASGYLAEILVEEGDTVDVGTRLAVISDQAPGAEPSGAPEEAGADGESARAEPARQEARAEPSEPDVHAGADAEAEERAAEPARAERAEPAEETEEAEAPRRREAPEPARAREGGDGRRAREATRGRLLSPVVRRLIAEHDLDPDQIEGTGAGGRITRNDVLAAIDAGTARREEPSPDGGRAPTREAAPARAREERPAAPAVQPGERDEVVPFNNIRRRTAEHMVRSQQTSAHVLTAIEVDYEAVERVRRAEGSRWRAEEGFGLTYLPFIARAAIDALRDYPRINASVGDDELIVHHDVGLGIAVDLDFEGLVVPVVQEADTKRMRGIAREVRELAERARGKRLSVDDLAGGTFTITNPGPFGTFVSAPIINQPQVAILSTEGVKRRPVVVEDGDGTEAIAVHSVGYLALSWDHRAFDGAYAASFLARVRELLETRDWSQEL